METTDPFPTLTAVAAQPRLYKNGLLLYGLSFLLASVSLYDWSGSYPGWGCAYVALQFFFAQASRWTHGMPSIGEPISYFSSVVVGWINPIFWLTAYLRTTGRFHILINVLRIVLVGMMPLCFFVFQRNRLHPREGYFVWIIGMLMVLFSSQEAAAPEGVEEPLKA
jgi:hypothetical protein